MPEVCALPGGFRVKAGGAGPKAGGALKGLHHAVGGHDGEHSGARRVHAGWRDGEWVTPIFVTVELHLNS